MNQLPPIVLECPECGEKYLISRNSFTVSEKAIVFSDGYFIDELNWRTPLIIGCVTCELGFFPQCGKVIAEPDWDEFNENWSHVKKAEPPTAGSLVLELRARKKMDLESEIALRKELWYSGNHSETGRLLLIKNEKFKKYWFDNLAKLDEILMPKSEEETITKAEINRQLGNFDRCVALIKDSDQHIAKMIIDHSRNKDSTLFKVE